MPRRGWAFDGAGHNSWRYGRRWGDPLAELLAELVRWPNVKLGVIRGCRTAMGSYDPPKEPGEEHDRHLRRKRREREARRESG